MSFFSGIFGNRNLPTTSTSTDHPTSADVFSSTTFQSPTNPSSFAGPSNPASSSSSSFASPPIQAPTAFDTFSTAFDPAKLHPLAGLGDKLDFLQLEEDKLSDVQGGTSVLPSRGWTDDLCVGTGTTYLSGKSICMFCTIGNIEVKLTLSIRSGCWWSMGIEGRCFQTTRQSIQPSIEGQ